MKGCGGSRGVGQRGWVRDREGRSGEGMQGGRDRIEEGVRVKDWAVGGAQQPRHTGSAKVRRIRCKWHTKRTSCVTHAHS